MGMIANYQSTTDIELEKFMCLDDVEEAQENENLEICDIDKMWDALHFLLTGKSAIIPIYFSSIFYCIVLYFRPRWGFGFFSKSDFCAIFFSHFFSSSDSFFKFSLSRLQINAKDACSGSQLRQLIAAHIDDDSFCRYVIQQDINKIALDLREAHKDDFFSVPEDNPLEDFLQTADDIASEGGDPETASLMFICKRLKLNFKKLSDEEKKWLKKIAQKSDLLKNPNPQRGRK